MTVWIAQLKDDHDYLLVFEARPTLPDLQRVAKGCAGDRSDWIIYRYHVHAVAAKTVRRRLMGSRTRHGVFS